MITKQTFSANQNVMDLAEAFDNQSILEIVGVERKEIRHSRFIRWFFNNPGINNGTKHSPFNHLMDILVKRDLDQHTPPTISDKLRNAVVNRNVSFTDIKAFIEEETSGVEIDGKSGSIDIVIRCTANYSDGTTHPLSIVIENKVESQEHDHQVWKYYYYMSGARPSQHGFDVKYDNDYICPKTSSNEEQIFVFLSPIDQCLLEKEIWQNSTEKCECSEHYTHISYQDIVDRILNPVLNYSSTQEAVVINLLQYVSSLGIVVSNQENQDKNKAVDFPVMAVSDEIAMLAHQVWADYKDSIKEWVCNNDEIAQSYKNFFNKLLNAVAKTTTDYDDWKLATGLKLKLISPNYRLVEITDNGSVTTHIFNQSVLPVEFVRFYVKQNNSTLAQLQQTFGSVSQTLFYSSKQISPTNGNITSEVMPGIWMKKNIWNAAKNSNNAYWSKLMAFINNYNNNNKDKFVVL